MAKLSVKEVIERFNFLKGERVNWDDHWQELAEFTLPNKATITVKTTPGEKRNVQLFDNTGMHSAEKLAGALHSLLTNSNTEFFELTSGNDKVDSIDSVRIWLQDTTRTLHNMLNNSNFHTEVHELYLDEVVFGTAAMFVESDEQQIVRFSTKPIESLFISENNKGQIEEVFREYEFKPNQILREFGSEMFNDQIKREFEQNPNKKYCIINAVYRENIEKNDPVPYISQHVLREHQLELRSSGFRKFPAVTPRWSKTSDEVYGRSPAMTALPEMKTLNEMVKTVLKGAQKIVDPPLQAPDDGFVMPLKTRPGGLNYYRAGSQDRIEPIFNNARVDIGFDLIQAKQEQIKDAFFIKSLQLVEKDRMTAAEVLQRTEESMRLLGPALGRQQSEFLTPLIDRVYDLAEDHGLIEEPPQALLDAGIEKIDVRYSSFIAKTQRTNEMQNILRFVELASPFIQLDPDSRDLIDSDDSIAKIAKGLMIPHEVIRTQSEIKQIRDARARAQEEAVVAQQEAQQAEILQKSAPALQAIGVAPGA